MSMRLEGRLSPRDSESNRNTVIGSSIAGGATAIERNDNHLLSDVPRSPRSRVAAVSVASSYDGNRNSNFKVAVRVRPPLPRELASDHMFQNTIAVRENTIIASEDLLASVDEHGQLLPASGTYNTYSFVFDHVYEQHSTQKEVYENTAKAVVESALEGFNATIIAYGQTGTGKTYTMEGANRDGSAKYRGIIPRAIEQIFTHIQHHASASTKFLIRASYLQIYNEAISDLLKPSRSNLNIREDKRRGVYVEGLSEWVVRSPEEIYGLMEKGGQVRATGETRMNEASSRSHAVFIVIVEQSETRYVSSNGEEMSSDEFQHLTHQRGVHREQALERVTDHVRQSFRVGKLNLVDLAGSERVRLSGASGQRLEESKQINKSLSALGNVISALTDQKPRSHIPYRDSKLTRMLEDSLGGNCKTTMIATISPALEAIMETISTLKFANRAKNIRNEARINEDLDQKSLLRKYERELKVLRAELEARNKNVVDKRKLLELEEQKRRAEADKMTAIKALEARSEEFMREKEEKKKLEQRIAVLLNQITGGEAGSLQALARGGSFDVSMQDIVLKQQQEKLRQDYEKKLADIEKERETIEEEKAQVDRYKQLLLKQRDIMIALTQRLVERDEQIMALQDELDAYDNHQKEIEEKLDEKTALLIKYQRIYMEANEKAPEKMKDMEWSLKEESSSDSKNITSEPLEVSDDQDDADYPDVEQIQISRRDNTAQRDIDVQRKHYIESFLESNLKSAYSSKSLLIDSPNGDLVEGQRLATISVLKKLLTSIKNENGSFENRNIKSSASTESDDSPRLLQWQSHCAVLTKERNAVQSIMESKISVLVEKVSRSIKDVLKSSSIRDPALSEAVQKEIAALERLVAASITALRNAALNTLPPT